MSSAAPRTQANERLPLHDDLDAHEADESLIAPARSAREHNRNGFYSDPMFAGSTENPYRDTTESESGVRHLPLAEVIPRPWQTYRQIEIASYVSVVLFLVTGLFAVKFARRGQMHQSKGLMGMAQRDLRLATRLIYASIGLGFIFWFIIIPVAAS